MTKGTARMLKAFFGGDEEPQSRTVDVGFTADGAADPTSQGAKLPADPADEATEADTASKGSAGGGNTALSDPGDPGVVIQTLPESMVAGNSALINMVNTHGGVC